jgi:MoaA/NifB/PqqE/SkfB family radical SAM enzyme
MKLNRIVTTQPAHVLDIRFWPTDICDYDCTYCFPNSHPEIYRYPKNVTTVVKNFKTLFDVYTNKFNKTEFWINLVGGGEPTLWPHFNEFCREIKKDYNVKLKVTTNASRTIRWWKDNVQYLDGATLSAHHEFMDVDHFMEVGDFLYSNDVRVSALMLMDCEHWDKCVAIVEKMKTSKHPWIIEAKSIVQFPGKDINSYNQEQIDYIANTMKRVPDSDFILRHLRSFNIYESVALFDDGSAKPMTSEEYIHNKWNYFTDWTCHVPIENLVIIYDGTVTGSCNANIFKDAKINIFSETFKEEFEEKAFDLKPIKCPFKECACLPDTHITKYIS